MTGTAPLKTNAQIGLVGAGDLGTTPRVASVDWFRLTPDREIPEFEANDEFDGTELHACRWARTVRYDSNHAEVADGELKVTTQPGDINGNNPVSPRNFVLQAPPEGDWVASTRFKAPMKHRWQLAGLLMYGDDDNYVKADVVAYNAPGAALDLRAELAAEVDAAGAGSRNLNIADSSESGYWYLRVTRTGSSYTAEVSDGGVNWTPIGATGLTFDKPLTGLGLMAIGPDQLEPVTVGFDYFHLETDTDDSVAPTTELTLDPATPNGAGGWYTTAPSFTLAADDAGGSGVASTEWRIGDGAWTAYAGAPGALTDATDGTVVVQFRSTDVAGNVEEAGSTSVQLDRVAPVTQADVAPEGDGKSVTLSATDATSGVAGTEVKVDDGPWSGYTGPVSLTEEGDHVVSFRSTDRAGLVETDRSVQVTVEEDVTGPAIVVDGLRDGLVYGDSQQPDLSWRVTPTGDAVQTVTARLDGAAVGAGTLDLWKLELGRHTLVVAATDASGNSTTVTVRFTIETSFVDVKRLVRRFAAAGSMSDAVRDELLAGLDHAEALAESHPALAVRELKEVRGDTAGIRAKVHRNAVKRDVVALIDELT